MPHQVPPEGDWKTWVILGGRGAGKTCAGAEWVRSMVEGARPQNEGRARRVALVGETIDQVREVILRKVYAGTFASCVQKSRTWTSTITVLPW